MEKYFSDTKEPVNQIKGAGMMTFEETFRIMGQYFDIIHSFLLVHWIITIILMSIIFWIYYRYMPRYQLNNQRSKKNERQRKTGGK